MSKMKGWYTWTSPTEFDIWHSSVVNILHLPRIGANAATDEPEPNKEWTTAYTALIEVGPDDYRASIEESVAAAYADGLGNPCDPPTTPNLGT